MKNIRIIIVILCSFFICSCQKKDEVPQDFILELENNGVVEVYSDIKISSLIAKTNAKIINPNELIDTTNLGTYSYKIKFNQNKKSFSKEIKVEVIDSTPPIIISGDTKTIDITYDRNICDLLFYADNYDKKPICEVQGKYDILVPNSYSIKYLISDSSNNRIEKDIVLNVVEKKTVSTSSSEKLAFSEALELYKNANTEVGIDVSRWQGDIDFQQVKNDGATFVIIRMGVQSSSNHEVEMDKYFLQNIEKAKNAGLRVGVYLCSVATSVKEATNQANWVIDNLKEFEIELPVAFDWEMWNYWHSYSLSLYDLNGIADAFINTIEDNGYQGMLYGSKNYLESVWTNKNKHRVWLAHYTSQTNYSDNYLLWQLSDTGRIAGINSDVDINVLYK